MAVLPSTLSLNTEDGYVPIPTLYELVLVSIPSMFPSPSVSEPDHNKFDEPELFKEIQLPEGGLVPLSL